MRTLFMLKKSFQGARTIFFSTLMVPLRICRARFLFCTKAVDFLLCTSWNLSYLKTVSIKDNNTSPNIKTFWAHPKRLFFLSGNVKIWGQKISRSHLATWKKNAIFSALVKKWKAKCTNKSVISLKKISYSNLTRLTITLIFWMTQQKHKMSKDFTWKAKIP